LIGFAKRLLQSLERAAWRAQAGRVVGKDAHQGRAALDLLVEWVTAIGLRRAEYGTHSLRRTKASMIYEATGYLRAIRILLGHTRIGLPHFDRNAPQ
jgi:integrase